MGEEFMARMSVIDSLLDDSRNKIIDDMGLEQLNNRAIKLSRLNTQVAQAIYLYGLAAVYEAISSNVLRMYRQAMRSGRRIESTIDMSHVSQAQLVFKANIMCGYRGHMLDAITRILRVSERGEAGGLAYALAQMLGGGGGEEE